MALRDLHTHTVFSDGKNTPEEMAAAALETGMTVLGFSDHSWAPFDPGCAGVAPERMTEYRARIRALREQYLGRMEILYGIEQDYFTPVQPEGFDYVIGSVHYVPCGDGYAAVDDTPEKLRQAIDRHFGGDACALAEAYWALEARVVSRTGADIIGHVDLIRKFNRTGAFFDEESPRYRNAALNAIDALLETGALFEINTGAVSRGWQDLPYPAPKLTDYIWERGGRFVLSSDSHRKETLCFGFSEYMKYESGLPPLRRHAAP